MRSRPKLPWEEASRQRAETGLGLGLPAGFCGCLGGIFFISSQHYAAPQPAPSAAGVRPSTASREHRDGYCAARGEASGRPAAVAHALASARDLFGGKKASGVFYFHRVVQFLARIRKAERCVPPPRGSGAARLLVSPRDGSWLRRAQGLAVGAAQTRREAEEGLSGGRAGKEHSPQPGIALPSQPRHRNQEEPMCQRGPQTCQTRGRARLSPAGPGAGGRACVGAPPRPQTLAMPQIAGASGSDGVCRGATAQRATGLAQHQPLQTPQTTFPSPGHVVADPGKITRGSGAPQVTESPGARASPFSQGRGWALPAASPQIQASAAAPTREADWPRPS